MGEGRLQVDDSIPTVEGRLRQAGYATLALSANGLLGPLFGRSGSFETYRCAEWWEKTLRWIPPESLGPGVAERPLGARTMLSILFRGIPPRRARVPPESFLTAPGSGPSLKEAVRAADPRIVPIGPWAELGSWATIDGLNRVARSLQSPSDPSPLPIAPWIEPTLEAWLARQTSDQPVHCFINFLDLHEKYLSDAALVPNLWAWLSFARVPQNARLWLRGKWSPTPGELDLLRRLYEASLAGLDRRMSRLIRILQRAGRWENTLLVVTSDHGQAFGEHGQIFHERSPFEPLLHVPFWVRWPHGEGGGNRVPDPVSLIDVAPTLFRAAGIETPPGLPGVPLQGPSPPPRTEPVLAMADGYPSIEIYSEGLGAPMLERLRQVNTVAYAGDFKAIVEVRSGTSSVFDLRHDPGENTKLEAGLPEPAASAESAARRTADLIQRVSAGIHDPALQERLRSWGYL